MSRQLCRRARTRIFFLVASPGAQGKSSGRFPTSPRMQTTDLTRETSQARGARADLPGTALSASGSPGCEAERDKA